MKQQVNLFQPMFRRQKRVFSAVAMLQVLGAVIAGFMIIYAYGAWSVAGLAEEVERSEARLAAARQQLAELEQRYPPPKKSRVLERRVERTAQEAELKGRLVRALSQGAFGNTSGFSSYLEGLARRHVEGTWLTGLSISRGGQVIGLQGRTLSPELVPAYVQRLMHEPAFAGKAFSDLGIARSDERPSEIEFTLRTRRGAPTGLSDG